MPPTLSMGESWSLKEEDNRKLSEFENNCLRTMLEIYRTNYIKMHDIKSDIGIPSKRTDIIEKKALKYSHVACLDNASYINHSFKYTKLPQLIMEK